jgi:hypothetical protein
MQRLNSLISIRLSSDDKKKFSEYCKKYDLDMSKLIYRYIIFQLKTYPQLLNYLEKLPQNKILSSIEVSRLDKYFDAIMTDAKLLKKNGK